jgi:hypothetical protein
VSKALEAHLSFMNQHHTGLAFRVGSEDRLLVATAPRTPEIRERDRGIIHGMVKYGIAPAAAFALFGAETAQLTPTGGSAAAYLLLEAARQMINDFHDNGMRAVVNSGIDKVNRVAAMTFVSPDNHLFQEAMRDQVNLWVRPRSSGL